jgi:hypothetical protein
MHGFSEPLKVQVGGEIVTRVILADMDDGDSDD